MDKVVQVHKSQNTRQLFYNRDGNVITSRQEIKYFGATLDQKLEFKKQGYRTKSF